MLDCHPGCGHGRDGCSLSLPILIHRNQNCSPKRSSKLRMDMGVFFRSIRMKPAINKHIRCQRKKEDHDTKGHCYCSSSVATLTMMGLCMYTVGLMGLCFVTVVGSVLTEDFSYTLFSFCTCFMRGSFDGGGGSQ